MRDLGHLFSRLVGTSYLDLFSSELWFLADKYHLVLRSEKERLHACNGKADFPHELQQLPKGEYLFVAKRKGRIKGLQ